MKKPQIDDYATSPAVLDKYALVDMPALEPREKRGASTVVAASERANGRTDTRPNSRIAEWAEPSNKRVIQRASFEVYQDQMKTLRRLSAEAMMNDEKGSMSEMVRLAIDEYVAKRHGK
jgi:hypothetical protein